MLLTSISDNDYYKNLLQIWSYQIQTVYIYGKSLQNDQLMFWNFGQISKKMHTSHQVVNFVIGLLIDRVDQQICNRQSEHANHIHLWSSLFIDSLLTQKFQAFERKPINQDTEVKYLSMKTVAKILPFSKYEKVQFVKKSSSRSYYKQDRNTQKKIPRGPISTKSIKKCSQKFIKLEINEQQKQKKGPNIKFQKQISLAIQLERQNSCSCYGRSGKSLSRMTEKKISGQSNSSTKFLLNPAIIQYKIGAQRHIKSKSVPTMPKITSLKPIQTTIQTKPITALKLPIKSYNETPQQKEQKKSSLIISSRRTQESHKQKQNSLKRQKKLVINRQWVPKSNYIHIENRVKLKEIFPQINLNRYHISQNVVA